MCGVWELSSRKFTQPMVRMIPQAHVAGLPRNDEGSFRPGFSTNLPLRAVRQNWSVIPAMTFSFDGCLIKAMVQVNCANNGSVEMQAL